MKVIFLDFDGVLNNQGSFLWETRRRKEWKIQGVGGSVSETLCHVNASNFQMILDTYPEVKIVVSSTWRLHFDVPQLQGFFGQYRMDPSRIIGCTPQDRLAGNRGHEIQWYLDKHPEITHYIIIDDNDWGIVEAHPPEQFVKTDWYFGGLTFGHAQEAIQKLKTPKKEKSDEKK